MDKNLKYLLYRSFDTRLSDEEQKRLENALRQSESLRKEKEAILSMRGQMKSVEEVSFKPFFADRVVNRIQASKTEEKDDPFFESLLMIFRPLALTAIALILIVAGFNISRSGQISIEGALAVPEATLDEAYAASLALTLEEE